MGTAVDAAKYSAVKETLRGMLFSFSEKKCIKLPFTNITCLVSQPLTVADRSDRNASNRYTNMM